MYTDSVGCHCFEDSKRMSAGCTRDSPCSQDGYLAYKRKRREDGGRRQNCWALHVSVMATLPDLGPRAESTKLILAVSISLCKVSAQCRYNAYRTCKSCTRASPVMEQPRLGTSWSSSLTSLFHFSCPCTSHWAAHHLLGHLECLRMAS